MEDSAPKYKIGDFVRCAYELDDFYADLYEDIEENPYFPFYGIIIHVSDLGEGCWPTVEPVYQVYCLDGIHRFFLEDEMSLVCQSPDKKYLTWVPKKIIIYVWLRGGIGRHARLKICCPRA